MNSFYLSVNPKGIIQGHHYDRMSAINALYGTGGSVQLIRGLELDGTLYGRKFGNREFYDKEGKKVCCTKYA